MTQRKNQSAVTQAINRHFKTVETARLAHNALGTPIKFETLFHMGLEDIDNLIGSLKKVKTIRNKNDKIHSKSVGYTDDEVALLAKCEAKYAVVDVAPQPTEIVEKKETVKKPDVITMTQAHYNRQIQYFEQHHPAGLEKFKATAVIVDAVEQPKLTVPRKGHKEDLTKMIAEAYEQDVEKAVVQKPRKTQDDLEYEQCHLRPVSDSDDDDEPTTYTKSMTKKQANAARAADKRRRRKIFDMEDAAARCRKQAQDGDAYANAAELYGHGLTPKPDVIVTKDDKKKARAFERKQHKERNKKRNEVIARNTRLVEAAKKWSVDIEKSLPLPPDESGDECDVF